MPFQSPLSFPKLSLSHSMLESRVEKGNGRFLGRYLLKKLTGCRGPGILHSHRGSPSGEVSHFHTQCRRERRHAHPVPND